MKCTSCSAEVPATAKFCPECGAKIVRKSFCPECGAEAAPGAKFCAECGTKIGECSDTYSAMIVAESDDTSIVSKFNPPLHFARAPEKRTYRRSPIDDSNKLIQNEFYKPKVGPELVTGQILLIVKKEGPITEKLLLRRVLEGWGIETATEKEHSILKKSIPREISVTQHVGGTVYWPKKENPSEWNAYRVPDDTPESPVRSFDEIPLEEIAAAVAAQRIEMKDNGDPFPGALVRLGLPKEITPDMEPILDAALHGPNSPQWNKNPADNF